MIGAEERRLSEVPSQPLPTYVSQRERQAESPVGTGRANRSPRQTKLYEGGPRRQVVQPSYRSKI